MIPKLVLLMMGELKHKGSQAKASKHWSGYRHLWFKTKGINMKSLMMFPSDPNIKKLMMSLTRKPTHFSTFWASRITTLDPLRISHHDYHSPSAQCSNPWLMNRSNLNHSVWKIYSWLMQTRAWTHLRQVVLIMRWQTWELRALLWSFMICWECEFAILHIG